MSSEKNASLITLYDGDLAFDIKKDDIEMLGALCYSIEDISMFFEISISIINRELSDPESEFSYYLKRGKLMYDAKEQMALLSSAAGGNTVASERLEKLRRNKGFEITKDDVFGSFKDEVKLDKLMDYIESGSIGDLSNNEALYVDALRLVESMERGYGKRKTVQFLQGKPFNLNYMKARDMIDEATSLFFSSKKIDKQALRNKRADMLEDMAYLVRKTAKTSKDFEIAGNLLIQASKLQELDKADPVKIPAECFRKEARVYMLDPTKVGMEGINRNEVAAQIDNLKITEAGKRKLRLDANIEDVLPIEQMLDDIPQKD